MAMIGSYISVLFLFFSCCCLSVDGLQQTVLTDLREFKSQMVLGRFMVPDEFLSAELRNLKEKDAVCGNAVKLDLHQLSTNMTDPSSSKGKGDLFVAVGAIKDNTLNEELSCEMKDKIAVAHRFVFVGIPFTSRTNHGVALRSALSDSSKEVLNPFLTNYQSMKRIDRIEEKSDGTVFLYKGDDVMTLNIQYENECQQVENEALKENFLEITSNRHMSTSYPLPFDWGCEHLTGQNVSFCETLGDYRCSLQQAGADVCAIKSAKNYQPCPATVTLMSMTGFFQNEVMPFISELPQVSFEAEWVESTESAGLLFPCFTN